MGCDIHMLAQVRKDGNWEWFTEKVFKNWDDTPTFDPFTGRNYALFAALAGVRNEWGIVPVSTPKGLPESIGNGEFSAEIGVKQYEDSDNTEYWFGDHSHSWLTVEELDAYDWDQPFTDSGVISREERKAMLAKGSTRPESWCKSMSRSGRVSVSTVRDMDFSIECDFGRLLGLPEPDEYTVLQWTEPIRSRVGEFLDETMPTLRSLGAPCDVRIVFGFDS